MTCRCDSAFARLVLCTLLAAVCGAPAAAADLPDDFSLRGPLNPGPVRWDGVVMGAGIGYSSMNADFGNSTSSQVAFILRNTAIEQQYAPSTWTTLPNKTTDSKSFNIFLGYNWQPTDDLVLGADLAYNRPQHLEADASDSMTRIVTLADGTVDTATISGASSAKLVDYMTLRGRAGYAFGQFLPYAILGGALGRFNYSNTSTVNLDQAPAGGGPHIPFAQTETQSQNNVFGGGWVFGGGLDVAVTPNIFVRGEWEYVAFAAVGGTRTSVNTARVGLGLRF